MAKFAKFHVGGWYEKIESNKPPTLGGTYGCYGIIDPSQVSSTPTIDKNAPISLSNNEMARFGNAIKTAQEMQVSEHGSPAKTEVEIKKRQYEKVRKVKG